MSMSRQAGILLPGYNPLLVANAPIIGTATNASPTSISVAFTAPSCTGGSVISTYTAYANCGVFRTTGASSPLVVTGLTTGTSYTFRVIATNIYGPSYPSAASNSAIPAVTCATFTTAGTFTWVAPAGVTSVSAVAIGGGANGMECSSTRSGGGGGLGYKNNISVTPGTSYTVQVGNISGNDSFFINTSTVKGGFARIAGGTFTGDGGGNGGSGRSSGSAGGGGAGGYSGNGGDGASSGAGGAGAGGGGGGGSNAGSGGGGGGGVSIYGQGTSGAGGTCGSGGGGGSFGNGGGPGFINGNGWQSGGNGGAYGGGGGSGNNVLNSSPGFASAGAVRLVWPGTSRQFPSTNVGA